ncbi:MULTISPECIES: TIR domain-containing protein [unclassified Mesorhizobium]|uniref:TIR domain-containing protein n=1 Tax=unclassified Mesorhizobium TaxID=325217 RepID=UPI0011FF56BF|nr:MULTISPECIES: TIR domain-containing protein [unclassified Mesorhizobium]MDG4887820.1 nucleotide-binding protein [Mesorhizobium sp. WSM4887]TIQ07688.1 MAG: cyclic nucleotide-binding domain-containing protein [Mesorhizobium sp.]
MIDRFIGEGGRRLRVEALRGQKLVSGNGALAEELADAVELIALGKGQALIRQDGDDNGVYFIIAGSFEVVVNGRRVAARGPGDVVGEMAAIEPTQRRSATVAASEASIVARLSEGRFTEIASRYPEMYRFIAKELSKRLLQRNATIGTYRDKIRVFLISSGEAVAVARIIQNALSRDFLVVPWTDGVFKVASYPLQSLEDELEKCDFAIAVAHADDMTESRGRDWPSPRDNVVFELGLFMGRLNRQRAILMEPREEKVKLPSDLAGVTTIPYRYVPGEDAAALMGPACNELRDHINRLGPFNG